MITVRRWLGVELDEVTWTEKAVSILGGAVSILALLAISHHALGKSGAPMLVASMGASAVLLFAVPHGALSQPWPLVGGHIASALVGVTCARYIHNTDVAAACAVGLAIGAMHQFKFIHPPGGATALSAVIGGPAVHQLGYGFVWSPVVINVAVILAVAVLFNALFPWRRYPVQLVRRRRPVAAPIAPSPTHAQVVAALRSLDSFIDITEADLLRLVELLSSPATPASDQESPSQSD